MYLKKLLLTSSVLLAGISQATTMPMPISGGSSACVALCKDNKVYAWGQNMNKLDTTSTNILCLDTTIAGYEKKGFYSTPNLVDTKGIRFIQVDAGSGLTISGISDKGVLYYWGMAYDSTNKYKYKEISPVECGQLKGYDEDGNPGGKYLGNVKKVAGSTNGSYSSPSPAIDNCYFDLVFTDIEVSKCGAVELVSKIEIDKTDCINTPSVNDNVEGEKYDIFGRKIVNVQPQTIYIMNGKKYILSK